MINWIKRWKFLVLVTAIGVLYLSFFDNWQVYAQPLQRIATWYEAKKEWFVAEIEEATVSDGNAFHTEQGEEWGTEWENEPEMSAATDGKGEGSALPSGNAPEYEGDTVSCGDFERAEPLYGRVEDEYFADAVFIGDSRTVGMYEYGGLENTAQFYASTGLTIFKLMEETEWEDCGVTAEQNLEEVLGEQSFSKIYLMVGINEMGTGTVERFAQTYQEVVTRLQELQPDAIIYLQSIMKVTEKRSWTGDYVTNEGIEERNAEIAKLADNKQVFFLDVNSAVCDESGAMIADYTYDGVHLKAKYIPLWKEYLKSNAIIER